MNKKQQQYLIGGIAIMVVMFGAAFIFGVKPQLSNAKAFTTAAETARAQAATLNTQVEDLKVKEAALPDATAQYQALAKQFPVNFLIEDWVQMVVDTASANNVNLTDFSPAVPSLGTGGDATATTAAAAAAPTVDPATGQPAAAAGEGQNIASSAVSMNAQGSPADLRAFLKALGGIPRPLLIDSASLAFVAETPNESTLSITGKTFLISELPSPDEAGVVDPNAPAGTVDNAPADPDATLPVAP